ncbi:hypothetical protein WR164_01910 [Philodulcilactobacillus myokoensis]|uniref:Uncharacterized protein n=1 Tax=Philodulcilactobacillus myokoensis TaxID=2929573 RepID=A0A9W6AZM4_9LACO|nr:hypothetical protein [Philodulcilactobacillus myokoensis]GLB46212.1 hypothetical protein WR164_01910 [Philodulcilactobacillus myokoensis]
MIKNTLKYSAAALLALGLLGGALATPTNASAKRHVRVSRKAHRHSHKRRARRHVSRKHNTRRVARRRHRSHNPKYNTAEQDVNAYNHMVLIADSGGPVANLSANTNSRQDISDDLIEQANSLDSSGGATVEDGQMSTNEELFTSLNNLFKGRFNSHTNSQLNNEYNQIKNSDTTNINANVSTYMRTLGNAINNKWH